MLIISKSNSKKNKNKTKYWLIFLEIAFAKNNRNIVRKIVRNQILMWEINNSVWSNDNKCEGRAEHKEKIINDFSVLLLKI